MSEDVTGGGTMLDGPVSCGRWRGVRKFFRGWLDWLYPATCLKCGLPLLGQHSPGLCADCEREMVWLTMANACSRCGSYLSSVFASQDQIVGAQPVVGAAASSDAQALRADLSVVGDADASEASGARSDGCPHCREETRRFTQAAGAVRYVSPARELIHDFKYRGNRALTEFLAAQMVRRLRGSEMPQAYDCIVPVPLHPRRMRMRGFNQSLLLARLIAEQIRSRLCPEFLHRIRFTQAQALTAPADRAKNIAGAFRAPKDLLSGASVLLVDDVMTTGATVNECAQTLREAGARHVYVLVWAR